MIKIYLALFLCLISAFGVMAFPGGNYGIGETNKNHDSQVILPVSQQYIDGSPDVDSNERDDINWAEPWDTCPWGMCFLS